MKKNLIKEAYEKIPKNKGNEVFNRLGIILNVKTSGAIYNYIRGEREPKISEAIAIKNLFQEYGIEIDWESSAPDKTASKQKNKPLNF